MRSSAWMGSGWGSFPTGGSNAHWFPQHRVPLAAKISGVSTRDPAGRSLSRLIHANMGPAGVHMDKVNAKDFSVECTNFPVRFYIEDWLERRGHQIKKGGWKIKAEMRGEEIDLLCYGPEGRQVGATHSSTLMLEGVRSALIQLSHEKSGEGTVF